MTRDTLYWRTAKSKKSKMKLFPFLENVKENLPIRIKKFQSFFAKQIADFYFQSKAEFFQYYLVSNYIVYE